MADQADQPAPLPPRQRHQQQGLQFIRAPPVLKLNMDLDTYLRRFQAYTNSIGARPEEIPHILINSLDDEVMAFIERHLADDITYNGLVEVLRREMGVARLNREDYKAKLRKTLRGRHEDVRSFYSKLWHLAKKAYPDNQQVRDANLRDVFVANFQDSQISTRLREHDALNNEQLLDLAVNLLNCKNASINRQSEVNSTSTDPDLMDDSSSSLKHRPPTVNNVEQIPSDSRGVSQSEEKLDKVIDLLTAVVVQNSEGPPGVAPGRNETYQYHGNRRSVGLNRHYRPNYYHDRDRNYNSRYSGPSQWRPSAYQYYNNNE